MFDRHQPNDHQVVAFGRFRGGLQGSGLLLLSLVTGRATDKLIHQLTGSA
jgi:hypothetical protein